MRREHESTFMIEVLRTFMKVNVITHPAFLMCGSNGAVMSEVRSIPPLRKLAMPDLVTDFSLQAKLLPPEDRARLAQELFASLDPHVSDVDLAWEQEIRRRVAEVEQGLAELIPAQAAFAQVRSLLRV